MDKDQFNDQTFQDLLRSRSSWTPPLTALPRPPHGPYTRTGEPIYKIIGSADVDYDVRPGDTVTLTIPTYNDKRIMCGRLVMVRQIRQPQHVGAMMAVIVPEGTLEIALRE
ncbi:hypothetical protein LCGC14_0845640 [marine sediment metagenome]|uniref:Uncharacterized protein n=1 Tax=marine sediment metagenome TaxID=412755 RepID=A0A0F9SJ08_9ZZZZ